MRKLKTLRFSTNISMHGSNKSSVANSFRFLIEKTVWLDISLCKTHYVCSSTGETFLYDFLAILKQMLQNFQKVLRNCFITVRLYCVFFFKSHKMISISCLASFSPSLLEVVYSFFSSTMTLFFFLSFSVFKSSESCVKVSEEFNEKVVWEFYENNQPYNISHKPHAKIKQPSYATSSNTPMQMQTCLYRDHEIQ